MGRKQEKDVDEMIKFCEDFKKFCENIEKDANDLKKIASAAGGSLKDEVGRKAVKRVDEFVHEILSIVYSGEEPVRELEIRMRDIRERMERAKQLIER